MLNDGTVIASKGTIGPLLIGPNTLSMGNYNAWQANDKSIVISPEYTLNRKNGSISGQRREVAFDLYSNQLGSSHTESYRIVNTIKNDGPFGGRNTALKLEAANGNENVALDIVSGDLRVKGSTGREMDLDIRVRGGSTVALYGGGTQVIASDRWVTFKIINGINCEPGQHRLHCNQLLPDNSRFIINHNPY